MLLKIGVDVKERVFLRRLLKGRPFCVLNLCSVKNAFVKLYN